MPNAVDPSGHQLHTCNPPYPSQCDQFIGDADLYFGCLLDNSGCLCPPNWTQDGLVIPICRTPQSSAESSTYYFPDEAWSIYWENRGLSDFDTFTQAPFPDCVNLLANFGIYPPEATARCSSNLNSSPSYSLLRYPFLRETASAQSGESIANSNRQSAVNYAIEWSRAYLTNPAYPNTGNNCSNFASQVLVAGGFSTNSDWNPGPGYPLSSPDSSAPDNLASCAGFVPGQQSCPADLWTQPWASTNAFKDYLVNGLGYQITTTGISEAHRESSAVRLTYSPSSNGILPGDVAFFYQNCGLNCPNHAGIIIGWGPPRAGIDGKLDFDAPYIPWFADNTGSQHIRPLNAIGEESPTIEIVHIPY